MNKTTMTYFKDEDILHVVISNGKEANSIELSPNITAEMNERGDLIGIEIIEASVVSPKQLEVFLSIICVLLEGLGLFTQIIHMQITPAIHETLH